MNNFIEFLKIQIIFTYDNTIQQKILMFVKTPTPKKLKYNVVYEIKCIQCNSIYIGKTCRFLHTRMLEHARSIKNYTVKPHLSGFRGAPHYHLQSHGGSPTTLSPYPTSCHYVQGVVAGGETKCPDN